MTLLLSKVEKTIRVTRRRGVDKIYSQEARQRLNSADHWPRSIIEAYKRIQGPYTIENVETLLEEEPLELFNGWLVWQKMTDAEERRIATIILIILDLAARAAGFGQAYMDQFECKMADGDDLKPDVCVVSTQRYDEKVLPTGPNDRPILQGGPEIAVEVRSPSNTRAEDRRKRKQYFENGTLIVWDVDPYKHKIWVYKAENPRQAREFGKNDTIDCEPLFPGWRRSVADFFSKNLSDEQMVGPRAQQWRAESREQGREEGLQQGREEGRAEGEQALRKVILLQAQIRFGAELPSDLENRLNQFNLEQLTALVTAIATASDLQEWLNSFPKD